MPTIRIMSTESALRLAEQRIAHAREILLKGLEYYEHDGHDMPKKVARDALEVLGIPRKDQP